MFPFFFTTFWLLHTRWTREHPHGFTFTHTFLHLFTLSLSCWGFKRLSTRSACTMQTAIPAKNSARFVAWDLLERQIKCYFGADIASFIGIYLFSSPPLHPKEPGLLHPLGSHWIIRETWIILHFLVENVGMYSHRNVSQVSPSPLKYI